MSTHYYPVYNHDQILLPLLFLLDTTARLHVAAVGDAGLARVRVRVGARVRVRFRARLTSSRRGRPG